MKPNEPGSISTDKVDSLEAPRLQVCGLRTAVTDYNRDLYFYGPINNFFDEH